MKTPQFTLAAAAGAVLLLPLAASGQLYSQDFEVDSTASWTLNAGPTDTAANYFFDYSSVGIPAAPGGVGTRGMTLQANLANGVFGGMSVSPTGLSLSGDYTLRFDWWANFNGPFPAGGNGSTNLSTFGIGTTGSAPQWPGGIQDSVWFAATADGGSANDYRAYSTAAPTSYAAGSPVYAAPGGAINSSDAYYAAFGGVTAPAAQLALFPQQSGSTAIGAAGMQWHEVVIEKSGSSATWHIDGLLIATIDLNTVTLFGDNIFFGHSDINNTSSTDFNDASLLFTLIDNIVVVPAPSAAVLLALGALHCGRRRRA